MKDEQINPLDYFAAEIRQDRAAGHGAEALAGALGARYTLAAKTICRAAGAHYHQIATAEKVKGWAEAAARFMAEAEQEDGRHVFHDWLVSECRYSEVYAGQAEPAFNSVTITLINSPLYGEKQA